MMDTAARAQEILVRLRLLFPDPAPALSFIDAYQLLVATVSGRPVHRRPGQSP